MAWGGLRSVLIQVRPGTAGLELTNGTEPDHCNPQEIGNSFRES